MPDTLISTPTAARPAARPRTWEDVCAHPALGGLPFEIEPDRYGRRLRSPFAFRPGPRQVEIRRPLGTRLGGDASAECATETSDGARIVDGVGMSEAFPASGDSDAWLLYLPRGAQGAWVRGADGALPRSARARLTPNVPARLTP